MLACCHRVPAATEPMPSDALTKALGPVEHKRHSDVLLGRAQLEGV